MVTIQSLLINHCPDCTEETFVLPSGSAQQYPAISALLYFVVKHPSIPLEDYRYHPGFETETVWQPLLLNSNELTPYLFPPEILMSIGNTLEIQAALMLNAACIQHKLSLKLVICEADNVEPARILKIASQSSSVSNRPNNRVLAQLANALTLDTIPSTVDAEPSFPSIDDIKPMPLVNRYLLALWTQDHAYFEKNLNIEKDEQCCLIDALWAYSSQKESTPSGEITSPLARHYFHSGTYTSDEVVIDRIFLRAYEGKENELFAESVNLYAHIKCALPYPMEKLDKLLEQCREQKLYYWLAYFLSYGEVTRSYDEGYQPSNEYPRLSEAFRIYKKLGDWIGITRALHSKSTLLSKRMRFRNAIRYLNFCLDIRLFLHEELGIARVLNGISYIESQQENFEAAIENAKKAEQYLFNCKQFEELSFTYCQISWYYFLSDSYKAAVKYGEKTLATMETYNIRTLPFRTKPDIHAQMGLAYFYMGELDYALMHSDYCESHKVDSTATGELQRVLLRALINDEREAFHLSDISFNFIPELLIENPNVDPHIEILFYRIMIARLSNQNDIRKAEMMREKAINICKSRGFQKSLLWFTH